MLFLVLISISLTVILSIGLLGMTVTEIEWYTLVVVVVGQVKVLEIE